MRSIRITWLHIISISVISILCFIKMHEAQKKPKTLITISSFNEPLSLDPHSKNSGKNSYILYYLYEGLFKYGEHGELIPALVEKVSLNPDLCTYTFVLRETRWSNGDTLLAQDLVDSWKRCITNARNDSVHYMDCIQGAYSFRKEKIKWQGVGLHALNRRTLEVVLERPLSYFLHLLTLPIFFPTHINTKNFLSVFNGKFVLEEWQIHRSIRLKKNPLYWNFQSESVQRIELMFLDKNKSFRLLCSGEIDGCIDPFDFEQVIPTWIIQEQKPMTTSIAVLFHPQNYILQNTKLREALAFSLNAINIETVSSYNESPYNFPKLHSNVCFESKALLQLANKKLSIALRELSLTKATMPALIIGTTSEIPHTLALQLKEQWQKSLKIPIKIIQGVSSMVNICSWKAEIPHKAGFLNPVSLKKLYDQVNYQLDDLFKDITQLWNLKFTENALLECWILPFHCYNGFFLRKKIMQNVHISSNNLQNFITALSEDTNTRYSNLKLTYRRYS